MTMRCRFHDTTATNVKPDNNRVEEQADGLQPPPVAMLSVTRFVTCGFLVLLIEVVGCGPSSLPGSAGRPAVWTDWRPTSAGLAGTAMDRPAGVRGVAPTSAGHRLVMTGVREEASRLEGDPSRYRVHGSKDLVVECREVRYENNSCKCSFVQRTDDCSIDQGFINYTRFLYCMFSTNLIPLAMVILVFWWLVLFVTLAVAADDFFCPSLVVISKTLRMSDNIAGVTLMAFGNGAPDVFSAIAAIGNMKNGDAGLAIGALVGAGIFVTTIVAGSVAMVKPFHAMERPFFRDIIFYLAAVFMTFYVLYTGYISRAQAAAFIGLYLLYVLVVIIGRYIYRYMKKEEEARLLAASMDGEHDITTPQSPQEEPQLISATRSRRAISSLAEVAENVGISSVLGTQVANRRTQQTHNRSHHIDDPSSDDEMTPLLSSDTSTRQTSPLREFLNAVNPIAVGEWQQMRWYAKFYEVLKCPSQLILVLTIPMVDNTEDRGGWNRHLACLHCVVSPIVAIFLAKYEAALYKLGGVFPVWALVLFIGLLLAVVVFVTSSNDQAPVYHWVFAYAGFTAAVILIQAVANEIVNLLQTFGIVLDISDAILGLTLLAWGNSLGDLVADTTMAKQGFPRTGISACFGGPLFNLSIGIGVPFAIKTFGIGGAYRLDFTHIQYLLLSTLTISLLSSLIIAPIIKFKLGRCYGVYLYILYAVFIGLAILIESGVV